MTINIELEPWEIRSNAINRQKAKWLEKNKSQLLLISWVIVKQFEEFTAQEDGCIDCFIGEIEDAVAALATLSCDLRHRNFHDDAELAEPELFGKGKKEEDK